MKFKRLILGAVAIFFLIVLMIYSFQGFTKSSPQIQQYQQIFKSPEPPLNTEISFHAQIRSVNQTNQTLRVYIEEPPYNYPLVLIHTGSLAIQNLKKGDLIDVTGVVVGKNQVTMTKLWLNEQWKQELIYLRSLPAIPFVFYLFLRTWKFNPLTLRFERRKKDA
jgi:hypothetical protein